MSLALLTEVGVQNALDCSLQDRQRAVYLSSRTPHTKLKTLYLLLQLLPLLQDRRVQCP